MKRYAVLVVEDHPDAADMLSMLLKQWGCEVRVANSGTQALREAVKAPVDVIFCDLNLPDTSGFDLLPRLLVLDSCDEAVAVSLSGKSDRETRLFSERAGFARHLVKPAPFDDLRSVLDLAG